MAEQCLASSTDPPSSPHLAQESIPLESLDVSSLNRRSLSTKLNINAVPSAPSLAATSSSTSSTASLTIYCIETGSVAQSIRRRQSLTNPSTPATHPETTAPTPINEGRPSHSGVVDDDEDDDDNKPLELLTDVEKSATVSNSDNDSFHEYDDDETIIDYSVHSQSFLTPANYVSSPCPICFEQAVLQVSPCCYFLCCNSCWRAHISATINDGRIKIPCVASECHKYLTRESIVNFVRYDPPLHDRYLKLYITANQNPRAKTCPRCCHLYSLDAIPAKPRPEKKPSSKPNNKKIPKQVQCSECSLVWCFRCSAPWHENMTCKQFIKGDKLLLKWINQKNEEQWNARKCPKCSSLIQRAGGCPHMTCESCSCEFCYLCGRRYIQIPVIGQHSNKFSMFGCPYNFYPERPWLRRTIRGMIATGVVVASPVIVAGAVTAAVTVLPPLGIYKLVKHIRARRQAQVVSRFPIGEPFLIEPDLNDPHQLGHGGFHFDLNGELTADEIMRIMRQRVGLTFAYTIAEDNEEQRDPNPERDFPLAIFAEMDVEHLFSDDESLKFPSDFRTCPTTPASTLRKGCSRSLNNLLDNRQSSIHRHHSMIDEH